MRVFYDSDMERVNAAVLTKSDHWQYEKEWRVVVAGFASKRMHSPPQVLTGITLGARISSNDEDEVCDWVQRLEHQVELRTASLAQDCYALEIDTLNTGRAGGERQPRFRLTRTPTGQSSIVDAMPL